MNATHSNVTNVKLQVNTKDTAARNETAPYLYGLMFEDINHSGDGGIYAEMVTNRAFQGVENPIVPYGPVLTGWAPIGDVRMSLDVLHPLSSALPTVMQIDIPANATGEVGFLNYGWWGMDVSPQTYTASFYTLANAPRYLNNETTFTLSLRSNLTGEVFASTTIPPTAVPTLDYVQLNATIESTVTAPNSNNTFAITMNATEVAGETFYFSLISLFPETFKNRPNGLRKDLAEAFYDMKPRFLRFPGGNNLEGVSVDKRWKWWETIGPLEDRPGRPGNWNYYNTDGLGLLEYLEWCEDMEIEPVLAVYAGFSLDIWGQAGTSFPEDQMDQIVQSALDELEYCMGDTSTKYGALRAQHGHPEPITVKFVEVGNEDWFSSTYPYRFPALYTGIKAAYPNITIISTAYNENADYNISIPAGAYWDTHHYEEPSYFLENFDFYDNWQTSTNNTDVGVLLGEYSVYQIDTPDGVVDYSNPPDIHIPYPRLLSAIAEGVYALGGERNPNTVKMSSYAPSLMNRDWYNWTPDMISFEADPRKTVLSASYWQQWLFAHFRGTQSLPVVNAVGDFDPLFWGASIDEGSGDVYVKVINTGNQTVPLTVSFDTAFSSVSGTIITADDPNAFNSVDDQTAVVPRPLNLTAGGGNGSFVWGVPGNSITVLQFGI
ncbi:glycoside hydrolase family 51 protein [Saccharata proteae CBS 121410]|uniref:non-reducing end alpha-L-arabinofuranosidase n=1 Tax=Saccharata proteae CBS 121410 TaxID=1314787 RepID=A0A9P4HUK1_9PEZI|nr:glycoside hydrolase family 51 protein [Saccharata proteae CBS 121410]